MARIFGIGIPFVYARWHRPGTWRYGLHSRCRFPVDVFDIALVYAAEFTPNGPNQADLSLTNDVGGLAGNTIESWHLTNLPSACGLCPVASVSNPTLLADDQYWIVAGGGLQTFDLWTFTLAGSSFSPLAIRTVFNGAIPDGS